MFGKRSNDNSLAVPPVATKNNDAVEVLRVWGVPLMAQSNSELSAPSVALGTPKL